MEANHAKVRRDYTLAGLPSDHPEIARADGHELTPLMAAAGSPAASAMSAPPVLFWHVDPDEPPGAFYSRAAADILADISAWAYADCETLVDELYHRGIVDLGTTCHQIAVTNEAMLVVATAFVLRSQNVAVLCFRGTEPSNAINFLTDGNVQMKGFLSMGQIHGGFHRNVRAVWDDITDQIRRALDDADETRRLRRLYITGHSLGAAMAVVAAAIIFGDDRYAAWRPLIRGVYTYGQPMIGDAEFARSCSPRFGDLVFRHVYDKDLVARMPPRTTGSFQHFGAEYVGSDKGWNPRAELSSQAWTALWSIPIGATAFVLKQLPLLSGIRLPYSIDDHSPNNYLEAFRAARD
jgi:hypothetical protein